MKQLNRSWITTAKGIYLCFFAVFALIREVMAVQAFAGSPLVLYGLFAVGGVLIGAELLTDRCPFFAKSQWIPMLFLIASGVSVAVNPETDLISNIKAIAWMGLYFMLLLPGRAEDPHEKKIWNWVIGYTFVALVFLAVLSIPMYFYDVEYQFLKETGFPSTQGFNSRYMRLWGLYRDPNTAGMYCLIGIAYGVYLFAKTRSIWLRVLLAVSNLILFVMTVLGNSRTVIVAGVVTAGWIALYTVYTGMNKIGRKRIWLSLICAVLSAALMIGAFAGMKKVAPYVKFAVQMNCDEQQWVSIHGLYDRIFRVSGLDIKDGFQEVQNPEELLSEEQKETAPEALEEIIPECNEESVPKEQKETATAESKETEETEQTAHKNEDVQGIVVMTANGPCYYENGELVTNSAGLRKIGDDYYFVRTSGNCATGLYECWTTKCDLPCDYYEFGLDGKMLQGIAVTADGPGYYVNGKRAKDCAGLTKIGNDYYFIRSSGDCATGLYDCWTTNCDLPCDSYEFGPDGKMLQGVAITATGPRYYENGKPATNRTGLTKIGNDYYFIKSNGDCATGLYNCWISNCDLPCDNYEFAVDGKMFLAEDGTPLHGVVKLDGSGVETLDRTDVPDDVSNGRFDIWADALDVFFAKPIFGASPRGISQVAKEVAPDGVVAKYGFATHNGYLEVLAGTGILGFGLMFVFLVMLAWNILRRTFAEVFSGETLLYSSVLMLMVCECMFISDVFFVLSFGGVAFWMAAGRILQQNRE